MNIAAALLVVLFIGWSGTPSAGDISESVERHQQASAQAMLRGDLEGAEDEARRALDEAERSFGTDDQRTAQSLMWFANISAAKGWSAEAEAAGERALGINEKALGPDHLETAATMSMLASIYLTGGKSSKAEPLLRRSVEIKEKGFGADHPYTAVTLSKLADLLALKGEYAEAERLDHRALAGVEKAWPPADASVPIGLRLNAPTIMEGLARVYTGQQRFSEAEDQLTRAATLRISMVGAGHPSMAGNRTLLGDLYKAQGNNVNAEKAYREALRITEKTLGRDNKIYSDLLDRLTESCTMQGKQDCGL